MLQRRSYDGVQCDLCHNMYDPHFEDTYAGLREGSDWTGYWDETGQSSTPSAPAAEIKGTAGAITLPAVAYIIQTDPFFAGLQACSLAAGAAQDGQCGPEAAATVCRAAAAECDVAEVCNGVHLTCSDDGFQLDGTACAGGTGSCQLGSCVPLSDAGIAVIDQGPPSVDQSMPTADQSTPAADQGVPAADQSTPTSDQGPPQVDQLVLPDLPLLDSGWPADRGLTDGTARDATTDLPRPGADRGSPAADAGVRTDRGPGIDPSEGCSCGLGTSGAPPRWPALLLIALALGRRRRRSVGP